MASRRHATLEIRQTWDGLPIGADERARVDLALEADALEVEVAAPFHGDPPPPGPPGSCERLWEFEVVELFLVGEDERYLEIELSPHGHYLVLALHRPRRATARGLALDYACRRTASGWRGHARVPRALLPPGLATANAFAIHGGGPQRRHLAAHPTGGARPDFHRIDGFPPLGW